MKARIVILAFLMAILFMLPIPASAAPAGNSKVEGSITNATQQSPVADHALTLRIYLNGSETESKTGRTDTQGKFAFDGLSTQPEYTYDVLIIYQEAEYASSQVSLNTEGTTKVVDITVYDSTSDVALLKAGTAHTIVYAEQGGLLIKSYTLIDNSTNLTYIGSKQLAPDKKETLKFAIPAGATDLQYGLDLMSCCVVPGPGSVSDTMPVLPGTRELAYSYRIPYKGDTYTLVQEFGYPTGRYDLLIEGDSIGINSDRLVQEAPVSIEGKQFSRVSTEGIAAGDKLQVELTGLPKNTQQSALRWIGIGLVVIAFAGAVFYFMKRKSFEPVPVKAGGALSQERQKLLAEIARLDDNFEAGKITEEAYRRQRAEKKERLLRLMRTQQR